MIKKTIALLVALSFVFSNIAFADTPKNINPDVKKRVEITTDPEKIVVPRDYGLVKSRYTAKDSKKLVIHIQDAHCNYEAQSNIIKILECLIKNDGLGLISVEGADGFIDTSWFKAFPDSDIRKEVADYFMKKGEITGPEFLSITSDYSVKLFGAETRSYYIENLNAFTSSYPLKEDTERHFNQIKAIINKLKNYIYSEELREFDSKIQDYEVKKLSFTDYVKYLEGLGQKRNVSLRQYENFFKLVSVLIYEKKIDFSVVDKERAALIDFITKKLDKEQLTDLVNKSLEFKVGKIASIEYYAYLKALAIKHGVSLLTEYPNLFNYIIYNSVYSKIENERLFEDIKKFEGAVKEKMFANDDQRTLDRLSRHIDTLLGLVNIKLLNDDFDYYKSHKEEFEYEAFSGFINKMTTRYGFAYEIDAPSEAVKESMPKLEDFYAIAIKRDKALVDNTIGAMNKEDARISVLVTGGFHSEGIAKLLEKQNISYLVVCPNITKDVETPYIKILTNQRTPLEDILSDTGATVPDAKNVKGSMLAPYLITAARINNIGEIAGRTASDLDTWARMSIALWLPAAAADIKKMNIEPTPAVIAVRFNSDVGRAVDEYYLANRGLDVQTKRQLIENARVVKELALPIITELLSAQEAASPAVIEGLIETEKNMYAKIAGIDNKENGYKLSLERMTSFGLTVEMLMSDPILAAAEDKQLIAKLIAFGKGSIFRFWKDLSGDQKKEFIEQLKTIKINSVEELYQRLVLKIGAPFAPSIKITDENLSSPHVIDITKDTPRNLEAKNIGEESYRKGEVALLELAGGTGSRQALSDSFPKIMVEVSIFTNATLAKERLSRIRAEAEEYGKPIPLIIMTSDVTNTPLTKFFNDNIIKGRYFGEIPTDWVIFVPQIVMPQVTDEGEYIIKKEKNKIVVGGFGHGDARDLILQDQKVLTWLARFGIKYILLTQVDNAFKVGCRAIGYHIASLGKARPGAEHISAVIVEKRSPDEKVGLALEIDKQLSIVEYTDIPTELLYKMYVYVINGEEIVFIKEGSKYVAKSHDEIRNMLKSMEKPGDVEKWVKEYCVSKDNIPEGSIINISDKPYTAGELRSQARLWLGAGSINQLIWTLSTLIGKPALPPIVQRGKAVEGYEPAAGKFFTKPKDKTGPKLGANKFECFDFDGWRVGPIDGAVLKVDRSGEGIEGGFAPTKDAEGVGSDTVSASQQIKSRNYKFLLKERCDWTFVPDAVVELTPAFAFGDGRYLPSKIKGKSNIKGSMRLSGRNTTVGENFNVDTGAEFILNVTDEYNSNAQVAVGKNITVRPGVKVTFNIIGTGRLVIEDNAIFDVNGIYDIPEGKELHIARDGKNVAIRFIKIDESDVGAVRMDGGSLTVKEHGARSYQRPEEDSVNGALANLINEGRARSFLPYRRMGLSAKYDLALVSWRMDYKGLEEKDFKKGFATDNIIRGNISKLKSLLLNGHGLNLVIVAGLKERLEKLGLAEDLLLHYGVTRNNVYMDEEDFKYLLSLPDGADRIMQGVIHEKAHIDNPDLSEDKVEAIASSTSIRAAMIDRLEKEIASLMKERFADETTGRRKAGLSKIIGVLIAKAKKWDIAERHALEIARQKEKDAEVFKSSKVLKGVDIENENMKHERARTDNPRLTPDVIEVLASSHNVRLAALMQGMRTDQVEAIDRAYEEVYKKIVENGKEYTPEDVALKYNISNEIAVALLDKVNEESGYNLLKREMYQSVIDNTPQAIKDNPLVDIMQKSKIQIKFTRANLGDFDPVKNPEGMNLKGWLARYKKEASASTAGIRGVQNILFPNDPRELIGQKAIILATVAKTLVAKELQAKNYAGRELHKLASSEVRYNSKEYVEFISRLQAALGIKTHIPVNKETIPIWMTSFLIFKYDLMGGEYVTSSHAISKKIATKDLNFEGSQYVPEESKLFVDKIEEIVKTIEQTGEYVITFSAADDAAIDQDFMKRVNNGVDDYAAYLKGGIATPDNLELIKQGRSRIFIDVVGGCMYRTMRNIFDKLGILDRFEWLHTKEDSYFHGIGKPCYRLNTDNGKLGLEDLSCDTSIIAINLAEDVAKIKDFAEKFKDKIAEKAVGMQILIPVPKSNSKIFGQIRASDDPGLKLLRDVISIQLNSEKVLIFETGIRILPVIRTMGYNKSLKHAPMGTVIELTDPDGDRLITAQIVDIKYRDELEALGLAYEILDDKRVLVVFMPNQSFLMTIDFRKEMLKRDKEWDNRNWFMIKTTASAAAWDDWAAAQTDKSYKVKYASTDRWIEVKGVPVVNTPVGFKEIASIMKKAEKQMREAPDKEVIIEDIFGNQINLGLQPSLLFAGEESGGEIFGPTELIDSTNGRKALAMREKSAGEAMVITSAMAADLERKNITLVDYLVSIFKGNKITNQFDYREDVIYFNESEPDINIRKKAEAEGLKMKEENDFFFLAVAVALRDDKITFAGAKAFLEKTFSGVDFTELKAIYFVGDGVYLKFSDRVVEIRPSGTEAKTKGYAMGASPRTLVNDAKELAGYYSGSMREQLMDLLGRDVHAEYFKDAQFMGTTMPAVKARAMEIYNAYLANGAETKPFVPPISYEYLLSKPADEAFTPEAPAVFDYTDASIMQSSSTGERVRNMAVEKFQDKGNRHLIFVKSSIPQIQLATTPAINLASMCGEYYNNVGGYTAHVVDSYEKAVELLAKNTDWNKTNTIVGLVDTNDLEAMSKNLVDNKMEGKTKLLAMEKFSEDQFVPIKGFFDLMSVMVQINKPLDKGNDSELIDGIRSLLNEIGIKDVNGLMDALSAGAYFEDPIKFAKNFIIRLLPPTKPCDTKGMKSLYDAAIAVVKSL